MYFQSYLGTSFCLFSFPSLVVGSFLPPTKLWQFRLVALLGIVW